VEAWAGAILDFGSWILDFRLKAADLSAALTFFGMEAVNFRGIQSEIE
jgi:hypothetical protein